MDKCTINLDIDHNVDYSESLAQHNVTMEVVEQVGPAGGNPNVNITGTTENVRAWVRWFVGDEAPESEVEFYMTA